MVLFECPGMIGPLDTATLARRPIIPFLGRERYDSWISEQKFCLWAGPKLGRAVCNFANFGRTNMIQEWVFHLYRYF